MLTLHGLLKGPQGASFDGIRVAVTFAELAIQPVTGEEPVWLTAGRVATVEPDGRFRTELADDGSVREPIQVLVVAPNGAILGRANPTIRELAKEIVLEVVPPESFEVPERPGDPVRGRRIRLSGRVLDSDGGTVDSGLAVVLWGVPAGGGDADARPLLSTRTNIGGYFGGDWPPDALRSAFGVVAGGEPVPVPLVEGRLPRRVLLVTDLPGRPAPSDEDYGCTDAGPPRAPDQQDLVAEPAAFSQDAGGRCVDFTVPNRVLEEFRSFAVVRTSQPDIKGLTMTRPRPLPRPLVKGLAAAALKLQAAADAPGLRGRAVTGASELELPGVDVTGVLQRALDDGDALLDAGVVTGFLKGPATLNPAGLAKIEHVSRFREVADAVRVIQRPDPGRAPLTAANPIDWDDEPTTYQATTVAHGHLLHFKEVWRADGYSLGDLLYSLPLAPAQRKNIAVVDWDRTETSQRLAARTAFERLEASLVRDRDISEVIATSLTENVRGGSSARNWSVAGGLGAFIGPIVIGAAAGASGSSSTAWQNSARSVAGSTLQQLRDRTMQAASAVRGQRSTVVQTVRQGETMRVQTEVVANYNHCHALTMEYFEVLRHFQVSHELTAVQECLFVPLLMSFFDADKILRWRDDLAAGLRRPELSGGFDAVHRVRTNWADADVPAGRYADESLLDLDGELWLSFSLPRPADASDGQFDAGAWAPYAPFLAQPAQTVWNTHIAIEAKTNRDRVWNTRIAPRVAARIADTLGFQLVLDDGTVVEPLALDTTLVSAFRPDTPLLVSLRPATGVVPGIARSRIRAVRITAPPSLPGPARLVVTSASMRYRTAHLSHPLFRGYRVDNDLDASDAVTVPTPLDLVEKRNPRERDRDLAERLIAHINEHVEHYHLVIWLRMHPNRRYLLLDGFAAPNAGGRSVATVVENRVIGIVGNCLVLPVAPGVKLDPSYTQDPERPVDLLDLYAPTTPIPPVRVSVPTRGVFAEAVLGSCNSCEVKDETRFWRWEEAPIPGTPAAIEAVSTASRRAAPPDLRPDEFPTPLVQIQNAPAAPDPTGLAAALGLIGTPNLFRDITGLDLNQRNAMAAFQSAMETAQFFGGEGAKLAQLRSLSGGMDKTLKAIKDARDRGLISKEKAGQLAESALRGSIGERRPAESPPTANPAVQRVLDRAAQSPSSDVTISRPNGSVSVRTGNEAGGAVTFHVDPAVPFVGQPSALTCWAAVAAMMVSWRDRGDLSIEEALGRLGGPWKDRFEHREGLAVADVPRLAEAVGLVGEAPASYLPRGIRNRLETGPLWVITDEDLTENEVTHAIVVTGISGDGTVDGTRLHVSDPVRSGPTGMSFTDFVQRIEAPDAVASGLGVYHFPVRG